jgi:sporulation protein YlmC with PRC-barrel domain
MITSRAKCRWAMRLSEVNLLARAVVAADGAQIGEVTAIRASEEGIQALRVTLRADVAGLLGTAMTVEIPLLAVQSVGDVVVLSAGVDALEADHDIVSLRSQPITPAASAALAGNPRGKVRKRMSKLIAVVDLATGMVTDCLDESLTLDIPTDLDWVTGGVSLDAAKVGRYRTVSGEQRSYVASPSALSRRARGEECLVAAADNESAGEASTRRYRIAMVDVGA